MRAVVTGAAGFIGSHLTEELLRAGHDVLAIDCFTDYYPRVEKEANLYAAVHNPHLTFEELDLRRGDLASLLGPGDVVFHQAGQPGVRFSWSDGFATYAELNVLVTQRLLEAARAARVQRFVFASSSSVYGNAPAYPTSELHLPRPHSPYGVTKLAAEHLCTLYADNWGVPTVSLRYFTVYGPRQRPDMAIRRLVDAAFEGHRFPLYGTGQQRRDFTYVADVVAANLAAAMADIPPGRVFNIAGESDSTIATVIELVERSSSARLKLDRQPDQPGDVLRTGGSTEQARAALGWEPRTALADGIAATVAWRRDMLAHRLRDTA